ncbi:monovalent cation/H+ antiporter complex subunit F [Cysteiniphilum sp. 6C5]|uniref:monovalent cation/H+ antiporter complex subunit F n=1 Tax=unclassified Cysteiniphilum TaxID=2610889 RepID=UPI003F8349D6
MQLLINTLNAISVIFLAIAFILVLATVLKDRCVFVKLICLEMLVNLFIGGVGLWALKIDFYLLLDICIALSLIMFLSTVAYCQLLTNKRV